MLYPIDRILDRFLHQLNITSMDALLHFNLAPLRTRRCIAMLAVIHRAVLGLGPDHFRAFFIHSTTVPRYIRHWHFHHLEDFCDVVRPDYFTRSIFGMISVYNWLPEFVVLAPTIKLF